MNPAILILSLLGCGPTREEVEQKKALVEKALLDADIPTRIQNDQCRLNHEDAGSRKSIFCGGPNSSPFKKFTLPLQNSVFSFYVDCEQKYVQWNEECGKSPGVWYPNAADTPRQTSFITSFIGVEGIASQIFSAACPGVVLEDDQGQEGFILNPFMAEKCGWEY